MSEDSNKKHKRYFTISLLLHLGFFLFIAISGLVFPSKSELQLPTVQIDMVALPNQVKEENPEPVDTSLPVKEDVAPPPPPEEKAPEPEPEPVPIPEKKAEPKPVKKEAEKRAKSALERLREQVENDRKEEERKKQAAVDKRKSDLKKFEEKYRAALRGNQTNTGTSASGALQSTMNAYFAHVRERLNSNWALPAWLQSQGLNAVVRVYIDGRGNVLRMNFVKASGNEAFDNYVKGTLQKSSPFAPPPAEMADALRNTGVEVGFPL
jgi:TonB family protein